MGSHTKHSSEWKQFRIVLVVLCMLAKFPACGTDNRSPELMMVNGMKPMEENPAVWSAVGLFDLHSKHIFCSASLIAHDLLVTASHCLSSKKPERIGVVFGQFGVDSGAETRLVTEFRAYRPVQKYGPNFDIAWVRFDGGIPDKFRPIEIWRNSSVLHKGVELTIAGYGRTASECDFEADPDCGGGRLLTAESKVDRFVDSNRLRSLIVISPKDRNMPSGPCFGDSGGPAYIQVKGVWYLVGDFMGWDKILVPENRKTICDTGEAIYNYVGAYVDWLEESAEKTLLQNESQNPSVALLSPSRDDPPAMPLTFRQWCEYSNDFHPAWYTTQRLIRMAAEFKLSQDSSFRADDAFINCEIAEQTLREFIASEKRIELLAFDPKRDLKYANIEDIRPLASLAGMGLQELVLYDHDIVDLSPLNELSSLRTMDIRQTSQPNFFKPARLGKSAESNSLDFSAFPLLRELYLDTVSAPISLDGLAGVSSLESLALKRMSVKDLQFISGLSLQSLTLDRLALQGSGRFAAPSNLKNLIIKNVDIRSVDLSKLNRIEILQVVSVPYLKISLPPSNKLKSLIIHGTGTEVIEGLVSYPRLEEVSIVSNKNLRWVNYINDLPQLDRLEILANPTAKMEGLGELFRLRELVLSSNDIDQLRVTHKLKHLQELVIRENKLQDLSFLRSTPELTDLDISYNRLENLDGLSHLRFLESLSVENTKENGLHTLEGMSDLPMLKEIDLQSNALVDVKRLSEFPETRSHSSE